MEPVIVSTEGDLEVHAVPFFMDNYAYVVLDKKSKDAIAFDVGDAAPVIEYVKFLNCKLRSIFTTHKHFDHDGGNFDLKAEFPNCLIYGSPIDNPEGVTSFLNGGETVWPFNRKEIQIDVLHVPCHTKGHLVFFICQPGEAKTLLFSGDTLFIGGVGKFFEGTGADMVQALEKITSRPDLNKTLLFCGHEYTVENLIFAKSIEPFNDAIDRAISFAQEKISKKKPTVGTLLASELRHNPYLRWKEDTVIQYLVQSAPIKFPFAIPGQPAPGESLEALRECKKEFYSRADSGPKIMRPNNVNK